MHVNSKTGKRHEAGLTEKIAILSAEHCVQAEVYAAAHDVTS